MRIWTIILSLIIFYPLTACKEGNPNKSAYEAPLKIVIMSGQYRRYEGLPKNLIDILLSLEFNETDRTRKPFGYSPAEKVASHNVKAYVEYDDGWVIASGKGEWGGVVFWVDKNGGYEIIRDDDFAYPIDAMMDNNKVLIVQGMGHLISSEGHLLEFNRNDGNFETNTYPINTYPRKFEELDGEWIIPIGSRQEYFVVDELLAGKHLMRRRF